MLGGSDKRCQANYGETESQPQGLHIISTLDIQNISQILGCESAQNIYSLKFLKK